MNAGDDSLIDMTDRESKTKKDIARLVVYFTELRKEVAKLYTSQAGEVKFHDVATQLEYVLRSTEQATHKILMVLEGIQEKALGLAEAHPEVARDVDKMREQATKGIEACVFQDVTGQRINKIMRSMRHAGVCVEALADHAGRKEIDILVRDMQVSDSALQPESPDINQAEIDKLFS